MPMEAIVNLSNHRICEELLKYNNYFSSQESRAEKLINKCIANCSTKMIC